MTILQLQYFQAVYEYRNMTRAANALYVSQPSVSTAIQELEDEFSIKLFLRTKPLQPTQAGQRLAQLAGPLLNGFEDISRQMRSIGSQRSPLRVGISIIVQQLVQRMFAGGFDMSRESLAFLGFYGCDYLMQSVRDGLLDLAIISSVDSRDLEEFCVYDLASFDVVLYTRRDDPLCSFSTLDPRQLQQVPLAAFTEYPMSRSEFGEMMSTLLNNVWPENILFFSTDLNGIGQAIREGRASCVLLQGLFDNDPEIRAIPLETNRRTHFSVIWRKGHLLRPEEEAFLRETEAHLRKLE